MKDHLEMRRHMDLSLYNSVSYSDRSMTASFLLWDLSGRLVGYQTYNPLGSKNPRNDPHGGKYFTYTHMENREKKVRTPGVWGLESFNPVSDRVLFLTEGVFDAVRLHNLGLSAVAVLANSPKLLKPWLRILPVVTVAVCDGDAAGKQLAGVADSAVYVEAGKDLGDLTERELFSFYTKELSNFT